MFAFPNVLHLFPHKLARLRAGRLTFTRIFARPLDRILFWHNKGVTLLITDLDVKNLRGDVMPADQVVAER